MYRPQAFRLSFQPPNVVGNGNLSGFLKRFDFLGHSVFLCLMRLIHWIYFFDKSRNKQPDFTSGCGVLLFTYL